MQNKRCTDQMSMHRVSSQIYEKQDIQTSILVLTHLHQLRNRTHACCTDFFSFRGAKERQGRTCKALSFSRQESINLAVQLQPTWGGLHVPQHKQFKWNSLDYVLCKTEALPLRRKQQSNMPTASVTIAFTSPKRNGMMMMWGKQRQDLQIRFRRRDYYSGHAIVEILVLLQEFNTRQAPCFGIVKRQALIRHKLNCSRLGRNHGTMCLRPAKQPRDGGHGVHSGSPLRKNCPVVKHHQRRHKKQHNLGSTRESCVAYYRPALRCGRAS